MMKRQLQGQKRTVVGNNFSTIQTRDQIHLSRDSLTTRRNSELVLDSRRLDLEYVAETIVCDLIGK